MNSADSQWQKRPLVRKLPNEFSSWHSLKPTGFVLGENENTHTKRITLVESPNCKDRTPGWLDSRQQIIVSTFHEFWIEGFSKSQPLPFHEIMSQRTRCPSRLNACLSGTMVFGSYPSDSMPMFTELSQGICYDFSVKRVFGKSLGASYHWGYFE